MPSITQSAKPTVPNPATPVALPNRPPTPLAGSPQTSGFHARIWIPMGGSARRTDHQPFTRSANILRKNLQLWDSTLRSARGENWPSMLGRLNAALVSRIDRLVCRTLLTAPYGPHSAMR